MTFCDSDNIPLTPGYLAGVTSPLIIDINHFNSGIDFKRANMTSIDVRFSRLN